MQLAAQSLGSRATSNNEDGFICLTLKGYLETNGCVFADYELARRFSIETLRQGDGIASIMGSFGFHDHNKTILSLVNEVFGGVYSLPQSIFSEA